MLCGMLLDNKIINMNRENSNIINNFLLLGDKFMPELHLRDSKVKKYSACGPFTRKMVKLKILQRIN